MDQVVVHLQTKPEQTWAEPTIAGASERIKLFAEWNTLVGPKSGNGDFCSRNQNLWDFFKVYKFLPQFRQYKSFF